MSEVTWHDVGETDDFPDQQPWPVVVQGVPIAMIRDGEEIFALHDMCTHGAARLTDGFVENGCVECPLHQGLFDLRTGAAMCAPLEEPVRTFPVRVVAQRVQIEL